MMFDSQEIKKDFPILSIPHPSGKPLVYLDSAATSQKPIQVINAVSTYYRTSNANVHRGIHYLGDKSTQAWHSSRETIAKFFGAQTQELVIVRNTTEALNFIALSWGEKRVQAEDVVLSTEMEHHSNLVPWQELAKRKKAKFLLIPVTEEGGLDLDWLEDVLKKEALKIKMLAISHVSNTLGTLNPIQAILTLLKTHNCKPLTVIDGAQGAPHLPVNFHSLGVDCYAVSAHKMLGPMGIGGVFVKKDILSILEPVFFGGGMIGEVFEDTAIFSDDIEDRFTAGTPDVAGAVGWATACSYLSNLGMQDVSYHDQELVAYSIEKLSQINEITMIGPTNAQNRVGSVAFVYDGVHAHDVAQILDGEGVAVRSGHHCTMPLHHKMQVQASVRLSFNVYTSKEDVDRCIEALQKVKAIFKS